MGKLAGKTIFITGASRGIGKAIALKAARDGANVVVAAKTAEPHPKLPGTIYTAAQKSNESGKWFLDLKNGNGACGKGEASTPADSTFVMKDEHFQQMFAGKLKPASAFMTGKMKIKGDMGKAMKLEKLMGKMQTRSYHTMMPNHQRAFQQMFSTHRFSNGIHTSAQVFNDYKSVSDVLTRIKSVSSEAIVKQVGAIYVFDVSGELAPASAFMTGKVKISGDLAKA